MSARIALISVDAGVKGSNAHWPHYGLVLLATVLRDRGHEVRVFDQSYLGCPDDAFVGRVTGFKPDLLGVSLYTTHVTRGLRVTERLLEALPGCRAMAGGPHVSLYAEFMGAKPAFAALVRGEAESVVADVAGRVLAGETPGIVETVPMVGAAIPAADFRLAEESERMQWLPIQLSRGCPFNCSFCEVHKIATHKIRYRDLGVCMEEIRNALSAFLAVHTVRVVDDCPTLDQARFKAFLRDFEARAGGARISIDNMRADTVDEELLVLLKRCRVPYVCVAAESGNPEVFAAISKGESLDEIVRASRLVRRHGIPLYMCFVIGLPGSTFKAELDSLKLAKAMKPDLLYWNMFLPHRGTRAREWFAEHGTIFDEADRFSVPAYDLTFSQPAVETPEFSREERIRAYLTCVLETVSFVFTPVTLLRALRLAARYRLWSSVPIMCLGLPRKALIYARLFLGRFSAGARRKAGLS